jgi:hypothetical protein
MKKLIALFVLATAALYGQAAGIGKTGGTGNQLFPTNPQTSTYQTVPSDWQDCKTIPVASGTFTLTLLDTAIQPKAGQCIRIINYGSGTVTVAPSGQSINGNATNYVIQPGSAVNPIGLWIVSDGTNYEAQLLGSAPAGLLSCQILDNAICTSSVDGSGNPNFLTTAAGVALPINGGTTPLDMFIGGVYQTLVTNVTLTVPSTSSVQQWILAKQDTSNGGLLVAADFLAMNTAPFYQYTAPTCPSPSPSLSSTNPSFWFDLSTNLSKLCTSNGGAYSASPSMLIGTVYVDATPKVLNILTEPYRLNPYRRFELFGDGSSGTLTVTSGTTTIDVHKKYQSVLMTGGTLNHTAFTTTSAGLQTNGVSIWSQSPVMIIGSSTINANALGRIGGTGGTGAGPVGAVNNGMGGAGGGGGGSGTVSAAGGNGANSVAWLSPASVTGGGAPGTTAPTGGGNAVNQPVLPPLASGQYCVGSGGGAGGGDGTHAGGSGGAGGGSVFIKTPSIFVLSTASITANGATGSAGAAANAAGGGGGGGGCIVLNAGFLTTAGSTITVSAGNGGASGGGTGTSGGTGATGTLQQNKLW